MLKCPHCGELFTPAQLKSDLTPTHDFPRPCRAVCPGSGQYPRDAESDNRPLWKDVAIVAFEEIPTPAAVLTAHQRSGGRGLQRFIGEIRGVGFLRVSYAEEPLEDGYWAHVAVSFAETLEVSKGRPVTDSELETVRRCLFNRDDLEEDNDGSDGSCRHLWIKIG